MFACSQNQFGPSKWHYRQGIRHTSKALTTVMMVMKVVVTVMIGSVKYENKHVQLSVIQYVFFSH